MVISTGPTWGLLTEGLDEVQGAFTKGICESLRMKKGKGHLAFRMASSPLDLVCPSRNERWEQKSRRTWIPIVTKISRIKKIKKGSFIFKSELKWLTRIFEALKKVRDGLIPLSKPYGFGFQIQKQNSLVSSNDLLPQWIARNESKAGRSWKVSGHASGSQT